MPCDRLKNGLQRYQIQISRICEYVTLYGKRDFEYVISLRVLR